MRMTGMNVAEVRHSASVLRDRAEAMRALGARLDRRVADAPWQGQDADRFRGETWAEVRARLHDAADTLDRAASHATDNADEQERASRA